MNLVDALDLILAEHSHSVQKHGTWEDYTVDQMMAEIINELMMEAGDAVGKNDIHGEHGVIRELSQVAACCIKAVMVLSGRHEALAQTSCAAGAHSCSEGCASPASLTHPQDKESSVNSPEGGSHGTR